MSAPSVTIDYRDSIAIITLNKPQKLNSLTKDEFYELATLLRAADARPEIIVTVLIGKGRFFSAGADVSQNRNPAPGMTRFRHGLRETVANNLNLAHAFSTHSKVLVTALNGPVVGMTAALVAYSDFIFAAPKTYLLTPFSSLGLVAEGGASATFVRRMGPARAAEALYLSKRIGVEALTQCGFVNKQFECNGDDFEKAVLQEVEGWVDGHLNGDSIIKIKKLLGAGGNSLLSEHVVQELFSGLERQVAGIPQKEFEKLKRGEKKHKL
ncbi:putative 3,2-trans-enoyl-CoA isomerase [Phaeosphaeriaceae sp. SRC1lsM3a]|nr:putative 3,2-trans-enoyl-CoA isomerase [Stagonospora sp. SRC1lsM3a]